MLLKLTNLAVMLFFSVIAFSQTREVSGVVTDKSTGSPLPGVNVTVKNTSTGAATDANGMFKLEVPASATTLVFSSIGFATQEIRIPSDNYITLSMETDVSQLEEVVVTVGRGSQRAITDTPLPVDNFDSRDLQTTGQLSFDKALQYRVPSFNTVNTPVNDATTLLDPYEIRNLGPSRTLILINGKRKNLSSLLYVQFSPGRGETGADLSAIPTDAIKRVEILRDGASAQYGSDAIAGVMNIILKDKYDFSSLTFRGGVTGEGDGGTYGLALNSGSNIGKNGFLNYTVQFQQQNNAVRSGIIDVPTELATFGGSPEADDAITRFLAKYPTGLNTNGTGEIAAARFLVNLGLPFGETGLFYANAAYTSKKVFSNANYRQPYWRIDHGLLHTPNGGTDYTTGSVGDPGSPIQTQYEADRAAGVYDGYIGYQPSFDGDLNDYNGTFGFKDEKNGWVHDISFTTGGNQQTYSVNNTVNRGLLKSSPTSFKPGGYRFSHIVGNIDISKQLTDQFNLAFGTEARRETYEIIAGDTASYVREGANSFPGIRRENATTNSRFNIGGYVDLTYDITENFLINGAVRGEKYSDFGNAFVWKLSTRVKMADDKVVLRGSASTGFRAPTLHQIYAQSTQASFVGGQIALSGLFNNNSKEAYALGIPKLKPEKSTNLTVGAGLNLTENLSITLDYYNIRIEDRIVYSSSIDPTNFPILAAAGVANAQFFINGIETLTSGLDFVGSYHGLRLGSGELGINLAGNINLENKIVGDPNVPKPIADDGQTILSTQIRSLLTESRPAYKVILGLDYRLNKFSAVLNNTLIGPTYFQDLENGGGAMEDIRQAFDPAIVTDLNVGYDFTDNLSLSITVNNVFNVLPKWELEALNSDGQAILNNAEDKSLLEGFLSFSGRYRILAYNGSQFSQLGTIFLGQLTLKF
jgi:iron complex outermembrane recepter protein